MNKHLINKLNRGGFGHIITLLDYRTIVSEFLKTIQLSSGGQGNILVDTLLCSGMNEYRFISVPLNPGGTVNHGRYQYVSVAGDILQTANEILDQHPSYVENSVLPEYQIEKIIRPS